MKKVNNYPCFQKCDPTVYGNYHLIALTSIACKIMESILLDEIMSFLLAHGLLNKNQHSTGTQLLECLNGLVESNRIGHEY